MAVFYSTKEDVWGVALSELCSKSQPSTRESDSKGSDAVTGMVSTVYKWIRSSKHGFHHYTNDYGETLEDIASLEIKTIVTKITGQAGGNHQSDVGHQSLDNGAPQVVREQAVAEQVLTKSLVFVTFLIFVTFAFLYSARISALPLDHILNLTFKFSSYERCPLILNVAEMIWPLPSRQDSEQEGVTAAASSIAASPPTPPPSEISIRQPSQKTPSHHWLWSNSSHNSSGEQRWDYHTQFTASALCEKITSGLISDRDTKVITTHLDRMKASLSREVYDSLIFWQCIFN